MGKNIKRAVRQFFVGALVAAPATPNQVCSVQFNAFHTFGNPIETIDIQAQKLDERKTGFARSAVRPTDWIELPCGDYRITARADGMTGKVFYVSITHPRMWQPLSLQLGSLIGTDPPCSLTGSIVSKRSLKGPVWIKLVELYSNIVLHGRVTSGEFELPNIRASKYLLLVFDGAALVESRSLEVRGDEHIQVSIQ